MQVPKRKDLPGSERGDERKDGRKMKTESNKIRMLSVPFTSAMQDFENLFRGRRDELIGYIIRAWIRNNGTEPARNHLNLYVICYIPIPLGTDKLTRAMMTGDLIFPGNGPDTSVIASLVLDALEGVDFYNNGQIAETHVYRKYADEPKITVMLTEKKTRPYNVYHGGVIESVGVYDKENTEHGCAVQVLENTVTGEVSVGWWKEDGKE